MKPLDKQIPPSDMDLSWEAMQEGIWEKVEQKQGRRKKYVGWWLFAGSSVFVLLLVIWTITDHHTASVVHHTGMLVENTNIELREQETCPNDHVLSTLKQAPTFKSTVPSMGVEISAKKHDKWTTPHLQTAPVNVSRQTRRHQPVTALLPKRRMPTLQKEPAMPLVIAPSIATTMHPVPTNQTHLPQRILGSVGWNSFVANIQTHQSDFERSDFERARLGFQLQARYEHDFKRQNAYWGVGLAYTHLQSIFERHSERIISTTRDVYITTWGDLSARELLPQDWQGQVEVYALEKRHVKHHNLHHLASATAYLGQEWQLKKLEGYAQVGTNVHFLQQAQGRSMNDSGELIRLEDDYYKPQAGVSLFLELGFRHTVSEEVYALGQIGGQYHLQNWIIDTQHATQRPFVYQMSVGLGKRF
ncbi:MAG: hypothetical protein AAF738_04075 [Bacteroidota bacterium]